MPPQPWQPVPLTLPEAGQLSRFLLRSFPPQTSVTAAGLDLSFSASAPLCY